jgi:hypothetical protein
MSLPFDRPTWDDPPHYLARLSDGTWAILRMVGEESETVLLEQVAGPYLTRHMANDAIRAFRSLGVFVPHCSYCSDDPKAHAGDPRHRTGRDG